MSAGVLPPAGLEPVDETAAESDTAVADAVTGPAVSAEATPAEPEDAVEEVKSSPRRKARDEGAPKPSSVTEAAPGREAAKPKAGAGRRNQFLLAGALIVAGLLFAGAAVLFKINDNEVSAATGNTALLDVATTAQVKDQVSRAAEALFSYDFNNIAKTENAAKDLLAGDDVRRKYDALMGEVKRLAPAQKMVVTSKVTRGGVITLNGDLAKVMVFIDQTSTRADTQKTTAGSAQLHVNAELRGDRWKITDLDTYIAPTPQPPVSPAPGK